MAVRHSRAINEYFLLVVEAQATRLVGERGVTGSRYVARCATSFAKTTIAWTKQAGIIAVQRALMASKIIALNLRAFVVALPGRLRRFLTWSTGKQVSENQIICTIVAGGTSMAFAAVLFMRQKKSTTPIAKVTDPHTAPDLNEKRITNPLSDDIQNERRSNFSVSDDPEDDLVIPSSSLSSSSSSPLSVSTSLQTESSSTVENRSPRSPQSFHVVSGSVKAMLLAMKDEHMKNGKMLNWSEHLPMSHWDNTSFAQASGAFIGGDEEKLLARIDLTGMAGKAPQFELKLELTPMSFPVGPRLMTVALEGNRGVSGNIVIFKQCPQLEDARVFMTAMVGDIDVFKYTPRLRHLSLGGGAGRTPITGDVSVFKVCPELVSIRIYKAAITGDIEVFSACENIQTLSVSKSQLYGDVSVFSKTVELRVLSLSLTRVTGSIATFCNCTMLERLNLRGAGGIIGKAADVQKSLPDCVVIV